MAALRTLERCRILPPPPTSPRPPLSLTFFDIPWLDLNPVDRLFFYRFPHSTAVFLESHFPNLKSSLSHTLNSFYPVAGAIRRSSASDDRFEISYSDGGDCVSLTACEYENMDFGIVSGYRRRPFEKLLLLVPSLPKSDDAQPLLAIQITLFPNQGLCIALKIHHAGCDGFSSIHFLKSWAAANRAAPPPPPPSLDRSTISDPHSLCSKLAQVVLSRRSLPRHTNTSPPSPTLTAATFTLPSHHIQNLKLKLQSKATNPLHSFHTSTFVISSACSWTCFIKAKGNDEDDLNRVAHLFFSVDWRNRMQPPPPANYFGNCLGCPCFVKAIFGDIVEEKDGFFRACEVIGKAIDGIGDDVYKEMGSVIEKVMKVLPHKPLSIAGSPKLRVYNSDFGWGKPVKVEVTSIGATGAISMAESRDDEGGVEIGVVLPEDQMVKFEEQFNNFLNKWDE